MLQQLVGTSLLLSMMTKTIYKADSKSCDICSHALMPVTDKIVLLRRLPAKQSLATGGIEPPRRSLPVELFRSLTSHLQAGNEAAVAREGSVRSAGVGSNSAANPDSQAAADSSHKRD